MYSFAYLRDHCYHVLAEQQYVRPIIINAAHTACTYIPSTLSTVADLSDISNQKGEAAHHRRKQLQSVLFASFILLSSFHNSIIICMQFKIGTQYGTVNSIVHSRDV